MRESQLVREQWRASGNGIGANSVRDSCGRIQGTFRTIEIAVDKESCFVKSYGSMRTQFVWIGVALFNFKKLKSSTMRFIETH